MKKLYKLTTLLMFITLSTNLLATDYMVSGAGTAAVNGTYTPDRTNMFDAPRWKYSGGTYYLHSDGMNQWVINDDGNMPFGGDYVNWNQSPFNQNITLFTGWQTEMGSNPAPTIAEAGPLSYSSGTFTESLADDGSIDNSQPVIITYNNIESATFTENELVINNNLIINEQGAPNTIIQAAATSNTATHRGYPN